MGQIAFTNLKWHGMTCLRFNVLRCSKTWLQQNSEVPKKFPFNKGGLRLDKKHAAQYATRVMIQTVASQKFILKMYTTVKSLQQNILSFYISPLIFFLFLLFIFQKTTTIFFTHFVDIRA